MINTDIDKLTSLETAGQLVMPRIDFGIDGYFEHALRFVEKYGVTGFIIFNGEIGQVRKSLSDLQNKSGIPLFFGIDAERGLGQIVKGGTRFPFLMSQGAANNSVLVKQQAATTAREMKYCGLNLLFAPVLDINTNPDNPIVNVRAFGDNAGLVSKLGAAFYNTVKSEGIFACGKHYPGHGPTNTDSHMELPVLSKTEQQLLDLELIPFKEAVDSDIDFIMAAHLSNDIIDESDVPSIISKRLITGLLRDKLGYNNVVITDSFRMDALRDLGAEEEVAVKSVIAGCDIILDPLDGESLIQKLADKIDSDQEFSIQAKNSVKRQFELKRDLKPASDNFPDSKQSEELAFKIARESVCVVREGVLGSSKIDINIFDVTDGGDNICGTFIDRLISNGVEIGSVNFISEENTINTEFKYDTVNIVVTNVSAWTSNSVLTDYYHKVLKVISGRENTNNILISFGSPYVIADYLDYNIVISSFEVIKPCQTAAADILTGKITSDAVLPVKL